MTPFLGIAAVLIVAAIMALVLWSWRRPVLGPVNGRLRGCPPSPNCVCSQAADEAHRTAPLSFTGDPEAALSALKGIVVRQPGAVLIGESEHYLRFEVTTPLLRFVDDLEFLLDPEQGVIHVRSASRVGRSDLGANRRRVEAIRAQFAAARAGGRPMNEAG